MRAVVCALSAVTRPNAILFSETVIEAEVHLLNAARGTLALPRSTASLSRPQHDLSRQRSCHLERVLFLQAVCGRSFG